MADLVILETYPEYFSAHIIKQRLEAEGIPAFLQDENMITMDWLYKQALGGIKLRVSSLDVDKAYEFITLWQKEGAAQTEDVTYDEDTEQLDPDNKICPHCGSKNTRKEEYQKKTGFLGILMLGFPLMFSSNKWYCFHCGKHFTP